MLNKQGLVTPKFKYAQQPIVLRHLEESRPTRGGGYLSLNFVKDNKGNYRYLPAFKIDDNSVRDVLFVELARPTDENGESIVKPPIKFRLKYSSVSLVRWIAVSEVKKGFDMLEKFLGSNELDEVRYLISDDHIYRFILSNIISWVHMFLSFMAFKNDGT